MRASRSRSKSRGYSPDISQMSTHKPTAMQTLDEKLRTRVGLQPNQNRSQPPHGYKKFVRSKPMDLTRVQYNNNLEIEDYKGDKTDVNFTGGKILENNQFAKTDAKNRIDQVIQKIKHQLN